MNPSLHSRRSSRIIRTRSFALSDDLRKRIEIVCRRIFGAKPDPQTLKANPLITYLVSEVYLEICDSEKGDYLHFPFEGSIMEQPYWTMRVLDLIRLNYKLTMGEKRKEEAQKMQAKQKSGRKKGLR